MPMMVAAAILSTTMRLILPIRPDQTRRHAFASAMRDVRTALAGGDTINWTSLRCDRIVRYAQVDHGAAVVRTRRLKPAFAIAHQEASAARARDQLRVFDRDPVLRQAATRARHALAGGTLGEIEAAARSLLRSGREADAARHLAVARAVSDLVAVARAMARHRGFLQSVLNAAA